MGAVSFWLELPDGWRLCPVFSCQLTETGCWYFGDSIPDSDFCPPVDDAGEFEVERVLDHHKVCCGHVWVDEYLVKWVGYGLFEAT